ncbi:MAG: M18 family aminopeptidase [Rhabdochlamydiaceae bacterium]|nr:M18 family aminopeptidase [Candidatus Amphrikana amoebophyrae]
MQSLVKNFKAFVDSSPTSFHAAKNIAAHLKKSGFSELNEKKTFSLSYGKSYYIIRNGSIIAFTLPKKEAKRAVIIGSHTDSPSFKLKPKFFNSDGIEQASIEVYGGPHIPSFSAADLKIAGRLLVKTNNGIEEKLVDFDQSPCVIANAPIHLDPSPNSEGFKLDPQTQVCPILGFSDGKKDWLSKQITNGTILSHDLFLVPCDPMRLLGINGEIISSYRIDNLSSAFSSLIGITKATVKSDTIQMAVFWDHEEIGSGSEEGASSPFFLDTLQRICIKLDLTDEDFFCLKNNSFSLSLDAAHAFHPNYPSLYSKDHAPVLGKGTAIKMNANKRYATSGPGIAKLIDMLKTKKIDHQIYVNHASKKCGSTIGHIFASQTGIETVDMGAPILGMHSVKEQMATSDIISMCALCQSTFDLL